jgi:hypothetical protein
MQMVSKGVETMIAVLVGCLALLWGIYSLVCALPRMQ